MKRREFLQEATVLSLLQTALHAGTGMSRENQQPRGRYTPGRITNEYSLLLPGERAALERSPTVTRIKADGVHVRLGGQQQFLKLSESIGGWQLIALLPWLDGIATAVFEKHVTHQGAIVCLTEGGEIARIPKHIGDLARIQPRPASTPHGIKFERPAKYVPGPDTLAEYILNSAEDPGYENIAALGPEFIGWTLVANEEAGPEKLLWLEADGKSRQFGTNPQSLWAPDLTGRLFDPQRFLPSPYLYDYVPGYSKRTLIGGFLPAADIGVWNPKFGLGYEVMVVLPEGADARPLGRVRAMLPEAKSGLIPGQDTDATSSLPAAQFVDRYWNGTREEFFTALVGVWNKWLHFFEDRMHVEIPDQWLLDAARAGIVLSRCSYRGPNPSYQIGEGAYTKIPERSHALFPVANYEFIWAHQLWNLTAEAEPYFQHYLDHYILPDGNFLYNTQDQVEAPLNAGVFLENSARAYDYTHDYGALQKRLPALRRMIGFVLKRYGYSKQAYPPGDPRYGLIWGSPEADNGEPDDDFPESHPYYYQNASWTWRGLHGHALCLALAASEHNDEPLRQEAARISSLAAEMRVNIDRSLAKALAARSPEMKQAGITPFTPFDTKRKPTELSSYENHRYMMDWWTSDWGDPALDEGHFRHRIIAGEQMLGMNTDGAFPRTSNFMEHGTLAWKIRQEDYRSYLLTLYAVLCYAMDCGNRYSPEDALLPGSFPGEGSPYGWSAVINSELQPALGLRWLLCYEEHDRNVVHLQKAAPASWFARGEKIQVLRCPTRFGPVSWTTQSLPGAGERPVWRVNILFVNSFAADLIIHIHPPDRRPLSKASKGTLQKDRVILPAALLAGKTEIEIEIA